MGAVHTVDKLTSPCGGSLGGKTLLDTAAISARFPASEKSWGLHSPQAVPAAKSPSGVNIINTARPIHKGRVVRHPAAVDSVLRLKSGAVNRRRDKSVFCRKATTPPVMTNSTGPAISKCPIIIAGRATLSGNGA